MKPIYSCVLLIRAQHGTTGYSADTAFGFLEGSRKYLSGIYVPARRCASRKGPLQMSICWCSNGDIMMLCVSTTTIYASVLEGEVERVNYLLQSPS